MVLPYGCPWKPRPYRKCVKLGEVANEISPEKVHAVSIQKKDTKILSERTEITLMLLMPKIRTSTSFGIDISKDHMLDNTASNQTYYSHNTQTE